MVKHVSKLRLLILTLPAMLAACGGGSSDDPGPSLSMNQPPTADAGPDRTVDEQSAVQLNGSGSDPDGSVSATLWNQISGDPVSLADADSSSTSFTAPTVSETTELIFAFSVTDDSGETTTDEVVVTVLPVQSAPVATNVQIAGNPLVGEVLTGQYDYADEDGDAEGDSTYRWLRNGAPIADATFQTYTVSAADQATSITFEVVPAALTGLSPGLASVSPEVNIEAIARPGVPDANVNVAIKQLRFTWSEVSDATYYRVLQNSDGSTGFTPISDDLPAGASSFDFDIAVPLHDFDRAAYVVEACNPGGCTASSELNVMNGMLSAIGYFKASNTTAADDFGYSVAISADGSTLAVGAESEDSSATGVNGDQSNDLATGSGAVFIYRFDGRNWTQQAYVKASNTGEGDKFGNSVALSADGNTLAVGAGFEDSSATGINGDQDADTLLVAGAAYVFRFDGNDWSQEAYVKASNTGDRDRFGHAVALSNDGNTLAVSAFAEDSDAIGINGDQNNDLAEASGAVYVYRFNSSTWEQQAYLKASNAEASDDFGWSISMSGGGNTLAVVAWDEASSATGINGDQSNNLTLNSGAAYVFRSDGDNWWQEAYVKASNPDENDNFGTSIALSEDGNTLAVGAPYESSSARGMFGDEQDNSAGRAGAVYLYRFDAGAWRQQAYLKASNTDANDRFGRSVALSGDGNRLAVGAHFEASDAVGISGDQSSNAADLAGAAYLFDFDATGWRQSAYIKAPNTDAGDYFGSALSMSRDGETLAIGAYMEQSSTTGIGGNQQDNSADRAGAVYLY